MIIIAILLVVGIIYWVVKDEGNTNNKDPEFTMYNTPEKPDLPGIDVVEDDREVSLEI